MLLRMPAAPPPVLAVHAAVIIHMKAASREEPTLGSLVWHEERRPRSVVAFLFHAAAGGI